jgi:hypothetical protein
MKLFPFASKLYSVRRYYVPEFAVGCSGLKSDVRTQRSGLGTRVSVRRCEKVSLNNYVRASLRRRPSLRANNSHFEGGARGGTPLDVNH